MGETRAADAPQAGGAGGKDLLWFIAEETAGTVGECPAQQPWRYTGAVDDPDAHLWIVTSPPAR